MARVPLGQQSRETDNLMAWPAHRGAYAQITWSRDAIAGSELAQKELDQGKELMRAGKNHEAVHG